jgi:hypothetical protein
MKLKNILGIFVSLLTIMIGGIALFCLLLLLVFRVDVFANINGYREILLLTGGLVAATTVLVIVGIFLITKEQLVQTLLSSMLALILVAVLFLLRIFSLTSSDNVFLFSAGVVIIPILIFQYINKANWRYIFATVYASAIAIILTHNASL